MPAAITFLSDLLTMKMSRPNDFGEGHINIRAKDKAVDLNLTLSLDDLRALLVRHRKPMDEGLYCVLRDVINDAMLSGDTTPRLLAAIKDLEPS